MDQDTVMALLRNALSVAGAALVTGGYMSDGQLQTVIGGAVVLAGIAWSIIQKHQQHVAVRAAAATGVPTQATVTSPMTSPAPMAQAMSASAAKSP